MSGVRAMAISLDRIYHPSHRVTDLEQTEEFFRRVFGRYSLPRSGLIMAGVIRQPEEFPTNYCSFTPIADVYFDSIDPERYIWDGRQAYPSVTRSHLDGYGWAVGEGMQEIWDACQARGIRLTDQWNNIVEGAQIPSASFKSTPLYWTLEDDTGLRYEFYPTSSIQSYDPRSLPGWTLPKVSPDDPLRIRRSSHHTVLTCDLGRALQLFVEILGGEVIDEAENRAWGSRSTFVRLAGDVHELAGLEPDARTASGEDLRARLPLDSYYSISFLVDDLDAAAAHLRRHGVEAQWSSETGIVTDPATSIGVAWGFYSEPPYAG